MAKIDAFYKNMSEMLDDFEEYAAYERNGVIPRGIRVNSLKITPEMLQNLFLSGAFPSDFDMRESGFSSDSFFVSDGAAKSPYYHAGLYYSQEPSASCTIEALKPYMGERVLDMCAAPGGKATHAAAVMSGKGVLVANEINYGRAKILRANLERTGVRNAVVLNNAPDKIAELLPGYFDTVIVDAPCSGEGMFIKEPQAREMWSAEYVEECALRQLEILESADKCLKTGGVIAYSTCTFNETENEGVIRKFVSAHDYSVINIDNIRNCTPSKDPAGAIKVFPHRHGGLGHFVALIRKESGTDNPKIKFTSPFKSPKIGGIYESARFLTDKIWSDFAEYNGGIFVLPQELPIVKGLNVLSAGVKAFDISGGGRLEPHHAFIMAIASGEYANAIALDKENTIRFLAGEEISADGAAKGYASATVDGYALGLVKVSGGTAKNKLPKGLRVKI